MLFLDTCTSLRYCNFFNAQNVAPTIPPMIDRCDGAICDIRSLIPTRKERSYVETFDGGDTIVSASVVNARYKRSLVSTLTHSNYSRYVANLHSRDTYPFV